jgi:hypothetical protein
MKVPQEIARHLREVHFGGNWTFVNLKDTLSDITWQQATTKVPNFNTIAALVYHMNYYVSLVTKVLQGGPLDGKDKYSWEMPPIESQEAWEQLRDKTFTDAENFARQIEQVPEDILGEVFHDTKYGNYYRNLHGVIEHCHYHLGQIVIIKKLLAQG